MAYGPWQNTTRIRGNPPSKEVLRSSLSFGCLFLCGAIVGVWWQLRVGKSDSCMRENWKKRGWTHWSAACLAAWSVEAFPFASGVFILWWPWQWLTATSLGSQTASRRVNISSLFLMPFHTEVRSPLYKSARGHEALRRHISCWCRC